MEFQKPEPIKISVDEVLNKVRKPQIVKKQRIKGGANAVDTNSELIQKSYP